MKHLHFINRETGAKVKVEEFRRHTLTVKDSSTGREDTFTNKDFENKFQMDDKPIGTPNTEINLHR